MQTANNTTQMSEKRPSDHSNRTIDYSFTADCSLYLENETMVRRTISGKWFSPRILNEAEWYANAEHTCAWIVGTLHLHDPTLPARVEKYTVHKWGGWYSPRVKGSR
jgi:hypothetical protein